MVVGGMFGGSYLETTVKRKTMHSWFSELVEKPCSCFVACCKIFVVRA